MTSLIDKLFLKEQFESKETIENLKLKLEKNDKLDFDIYWMSNNKFKISPKFAFGGDDIIGYGIMIEKENSSTLIQLTTKLPIVQSIWIFFVFIIFGYSILNLEWFPIWAYFVPFVGFLWFWFIYRYQEQLLFDDFKQVLLSKK